MAWGTASGEHFLASNPASSLSTSLMAKTIQVRGDGYYKEYAVVGDGVVNDTAILNTAYADAVARNASFFLPGAIMALGGSLTWNGQMNVIGTGKLSTRFWAGSAIDMIVLGAGNTNARISGFSVDGRFLANHGFVTASSGGAATLMRFADIEISQCTGTPGTAFEVTGLAMNTCLFDEVKCNNNNKGLVIPATGNDSNTNANTFLKCNFSHNTAGNVLLGDDTAIMSAWQFFGCIFQHTSPDPVQDNILVKGVQSLLVAGSYHEFTGGAASTALRIASAAARPSIVVIDGMYAAGGTNATNAIVIDSGATGSILEVRGMQTNGITGTSIADNSAVSRVWKGASIEQGGLAEAYYSGPIQLRPLGAVSPILAIDAPSGYAGLLARLRLNAVNLLTVDVNGLVTALSPVANNLAGFGVNNGAGDGNARWHNPAGQGHIFHTGAPAGGTDIVKFSPAGAIAILNSLATAGLGVPGIYRAPTTLTGQTAAVASAATITSPNDGAKHLYRVGGVVNITTHGTESINLQCTYTDDGGTARTMTLTLKPIGGVDATAANAAGPWVADELVNVNPNTAITILTAGTFTGATYNLAAVIEQLS